MRHVLISVRFGFSFQLLLVSRLLFFSFRHLSLWHVRHIGRLFIHLHLYIPRYRAPPRLHRRRLILHKGNALPRSRQLHLANLGKKYMEKTHSARFFLCNVLSPPCTYFHRLLARGARSDAKNSPTEGKIYHSTGTSDQH